MGKTILEWYETFPEPYRSQAIANLKEQNPRGELDSVLYLTPSHALECGFRWKDSHEGRDHWYDFNYKLNNPPSLSLTKEQVIEFAECLKSVEYVFSHRTKDGSFYIDRWDVDNKILPISQIFDNWYQEVNK
jgi:hypothetical protein